MRFDLSDEEWAVIEPLLPDAGVYYYKARIYSPTLGRFLQTDPIGYGDGTNTYSYDVENRLLGVCSTATLSYDPLGRLNQTIGGGNTTRFGYDGADLIAGAARRWRAKRKANNSCSRCNYPPLCAWRRR